MRTTVAAIDSVNLLLGNMTEAHAERYNLSEDGLTRFAQDFYAYALNKQGKQDSPLGSHVNPHTGGGHLEGGYLGFASVQYAHMPLPGESLVAFLSDGAFEEQRDQIVGLFDLSKLRQRRTFSQFLLSF